MVRTSIAGAEPSSPVFRRITNARFDQFMPCTAVDIHHVLRQFPIKSCPLDLIHASVLSRICDELIPFMTAACNKSLAEGVLPATQKTALVTPLLKKPGLDSSIPANYRLVSNLTFLSKVLACVVVNQLSSFYQQPTAPSSISLQTYALNRDTYTAHYI